MKPKVIIFPTQPIPNACDLYRHIVPFKYSKKIEYRVAYDIPMIVGKDGNGVVNRELLKEFTHFLFLRYYNKDTLPLIRQLVEVAKEEGKKIVYETDDLIHKVIQNNRDEETFKKSKKVKHVKTMEYLLTQADFMTVTTEPLKEFYSKKVKCPIHILPNYYDPELWEGVKIPERKDRGVFRVGWMGGENHYQQDFPILVEPFNYLKKKYKDKIQFCVFSGKHPNQDHFPGERCPFEFEFEYYTGASILEYPQKMANMNLDLGIVVVKDNEFSRAKSNIKWMEYGLLGVPSVSSKVTPYLNTTALLVENKADEWIKSIEEMMTNKEKYGIIKQKTIQEVKKWNIKDHYQEWEEVYGN